MREPKFGKGYCIRKKAEKAGRSTNTILHYPKDFYDVYVLSQEYPFLYQKLYQAVVETFTNRKTPLTMDTIVFRPEFTEDNQHQARWKSFLGKKKAIMKVSLTEVINRIQIFSKPLLDKPDYVPSLWNPKEGNWN